MALVNLSEIGRSWSAAIGTAYRALRDAVLGGSATGSSASGPAATRAAGTADSLRLAGEGLRGAFDNFATRMNTGMTPANTTDVVVGIAAAAGRLNAALSDAVSGRIGDTEFAGAVTERMQALVTELEGLGIRGVTVSKVDGGAAALNIDQAELLRTLDASAKPAQTRADIGTATDGFTAALVDAASRPVSAPQQMSSRSSVTLQLNRFPAIDPAFDRSRATAARGAGQTTYRKFGRVAGEDATASRTYEPQQRRTGCVTDPVTVTPALQPGVFEGIVDSLFKRLS